MARQAAAKEREGERREVEACAGELNEMRKTRQRGWDWSWGGGVAQPQANKNLLSMLPLPLLLLHLAESEAHGHVVMYSLPLPARRQGNLQRWRRSSSSRSIGGGRGLPPTAPYILCCVMCSTLLGVAFVFLVYLCRHRRWWAVVGVADRLDSALVTLTTQQLPRTPLLTAPTACVSVRYFRAALCTCLSSCLAAPQNFRSENQFIMKRSSSGSIYSTLLTAYVCMCVCALGGLSLGQKLIKAKMNPRFKMSVSMPPAQSLYIHSLFVCVCELVCVCVKSN